MEARCPLRSSTCCEVVLLVQLDELPQIAHAIHLHRKMQVAKRLHPGCNNNWLLLQQPGRTPTAARFIIILAVTVCSIVHILRPSLPRQGVTHHRFGCLCEFAGSCGLKKSLGLPCSQYLLQQQGCVGQDGPFEHRAAHMQACTTQKPTSPPLRSPTAPFTANHHSGVLSITTCCSLGLC